VYAEALWYHMPMTKRIHPALAKTAAERRQQIRSFKAKADSRRTMWDKAADALTAYSGTVAFLAANIVFFSLWMSWNAGYIPGPAPVDPAPFGLLTMIVSLEAIFLAIVVLISQNREAHVAELREEMELYINTYAEHEITKIMYLLTVLLEKQGVDLSTDTDLQEMLKEIDRDAVESELEKQLLRV
jgi:uncharacterized membrane protein